MEAGVFLFIFAYSLASRKKLSMPQSSQTRSFLLVYCLLFALSVFAEYLAILTVGVSVSTMVFAIAPGLNALLCLAFLNEKLSIRQYAGIALMIASLAVLSA